MSNKQAQWVLNGLLAVLLGAAWAADIWPVFTVPMILVALVVTVSAAVIGFRAQPELQPARIRRRH